MWFELTKLFFGLLEAISWPVAAIIIAALFRSELRTLLPRLRRAGPSGLEFEVMVQRKQAVEIASSNPGELKQIPGVQRSPATAIVETRLRDEIQKFEQGERLDVALFALASSRLETHFAITYNTIFGSQIRALRSLNERGGSVSIKDANSYFDEVKEKYNVFSNWTFEQYAKFLKSASLIEEKEHQILLTEIGREFLFFLLKYRLTEEKSF